MCVRVRSCPSNAVPTFDADERAIVIPNGLLPSQRAILVRAILSELAVPQHRLGAVCWCGAPVDITPRVPHQTRSEQVVKHGAQGH